MHATRSRAIDVAQHALRARSVARGKRRDGSARPAQADANHIRMPQREHPTQPRHQRLTIRLMHSVAERLATSRRPPGRAARPAAAPRCCRLKTVSSSGSRFGRARRDAEVAQSACGVATTIAPARRPRPSRYGDRCRRCAGNSSSHRRRGPPPHCRDVPRSSTPPMISSSERRPSTSSRSRIPAIVAAALLPSPPRSGIVAAHFDVERRRRRRLRGSA